VIPQRFGRVTHTRKENVATPFPDKHKLQVLGELPNR